MVKRIRDFFKGLAFGITEIVPGVSGGTVAIILGFYGELIETVNHFTEDYRKYLKFLFPFLLGAASGIIIFSSVINYLLTNYSFPTMLFFTGLIVGIIPIIYSNVKDPGRKFNGKEIALIIFPILLLFTLSNLKDESVVNPVEVINNIDASFMFFIFFAGILAAVALVIPGVSGSFVLLLLGVYPLATYSLSSIRFLLTDITNVTLMLDICKVLVPLGIGVIIGGLSMARLIEKLLKHHYKTTYLLILGLLLGSVYALSKEPLVFQSGMSTSIAIIGLVTFLSGCIVSYRLGRKRL